MRKFLALIATALVTTAGASAWSQVRVGTPSYLAIADLDVDRGGLPAITGHYLQQGYNGQGATGASAAAPLSPWLNSLPSRAESLADDNRLRAAAAATGQLMTGAGNLPRVHAHGFAQATRYFYFEKDWPMEFDLLLHGQMSNRLFYAEGYWPAFSRVRYGLEWLDANGTPLATVFDVSARIDYQGGTAMALTRSAVAASSQVLTWDAAFSPIGPPDAGFSFFEGYGIGLLQRLQTSLTALTGKTYGLRWTLEAEAGITGHEAQFDAIADFGHTAVIGLGMDAEQMAANGIVELLAVPVPEPSMAWLLAGGLLLLLPLLRREGVGPGRSAA